MQGLSDSDQYEPDRVEARLLFLIERTASAATRRSSDSGESSMLIRERLSSVRRFQRE